MKEKLNVLSYYAPQAELNNQIKKMENLDEIIHIFAIEKLKLEVNINGQRGIQGAPIRFQLISFILAF